MGNEVMSVLKKDYIYNLMLKGQRADGRAFDEIRDIEIRTNVIEKAEGSAWIKMGGTEILVGVKLQVGTPFPDSADQGVIITSMELNPIASPDFEAGPPKENAIEMARVTDRGIRESGAIDLNKLCITEGEEVWMVFIDIHVLNNEGNIQDVSSLGAIAALLTAVVPGEREGRGEDMPMPIRDMPVSVTLVDIGGEMMIDPDLDEETVCDTRITIVSNQDGSISGMQKSGDGALTEEKLLKAVSLACQKASELREAHLLNI
ncbi:MAG: exosome complex component [Methanolobus sp.]|jgi:exosome complex component RRP42|uniref:Exosome complex component Rrp42 n=1 Tax=Methanolobus tindarius DSM 2278 TaxID=1090322 RepID=W9DMX4_METTI|nr:MULTISPECIES: exosome complex protein Rrp42 [Methanolobus]ETA67114.1 RNase PH-related exoribonuclease [Methanolobus tindarius DSM 2278]MDI3485467.1 exosome complex component [Methanolobus sp.]MDK2832796.1 exosome complex component [Methanolobus sp.]MDK2939408.1 exosome complex component [Methanolobus sp.]